MFSVNVRNVHEMLPIAIGILKNMGFERDSRNGKVLQLDQPVTTMYAKPDERVLFYPERDANPFFHLFEALWMLAGRDDVAYPAYYAKNILNYSDDGRTLHGAYGERWRKRFGFDQLQVVAERLKANPEDRRQVVQIFDAGHDLRPDQSTMKDVPCNLTITFQIGYEGSLDMVVFNRSNDIVWGCYGANAVHFSALQEYMAARIGVPLGRYWQISVNWHGYLNTIEPLEKLPAFVHQTQQGLVVFSPYGEGLVEPFPLVKDAERFDAELNMWLEEPMAIGYKEPFLRKIATPMYQAYEAWRELRDYTTAQECLEVMPEKNDWRKACFEWLERRRVKAAEKARAEDDGVNYEKE